MNIQLTKFFREIFKYNDFNNISFMILFLFQTIRLEKDFKHKVHYSRQNFMFLDKKSFILAIVFVSSNFFFAYFLIFYKK